MTAHAARPAFDPDEAEENSAHKGDLIGQYLYRAGLTIGDVGWLPHSDRRGPSRTRLARAAYRAANDPCPRAGRHTPPHSATSETWRHARETLRELEDLDALGLGVPTLPRDLVGEGNQWRRPIVDLELPEPGELPDGPPDGMPADIPAEELAARLAEDDRIVEREVARRRPPRPVDLLPYPAGQGPALITSGSLSGPGPTAPRGWAALAALGPLTPTRPCRWCQAPAVVGTLNGWRCAGHPPVRCDPRGDWGWALDWAPKPTTGRCLAVCWCGRCPSYDPTGAIIAGYRAGVARILPRVDGPVTTE